jgi:uncharacterized RDD family membrane protein YckC
LPVETPENVVLTYQLAGPTLRCAAYLIDTAVRAAGVMVIGIVLACAGVAAPGLSMGLLLVMLFLVEWGYFVICEGFFRGQSIGKHVLKLRVIDERGHPLTFWSALTRNLVRAADAVPLYGPALIAMLLSRRFQRLGDLAARTVVIQERQIVLPREPVILEKIQPLSRDDLGSYVPPERTLALIDEFLGRRHVLTHERGHALAAVLARALASRLEYRGDGKLVESYPMAFLARVYVTFLQDGEREERPAAENAPPLRLTREEIAGAAP